MARYNILYIHNKAEISGGERSLLALWSNLDRNIYNPIVILPQEGIFSKEVGLLGVKVIILSIPPWRVGHIRLLIKSFCSLKDIIHEEKISIIHSYSPRNNLIASCVGFLSKLPVIWHERNIPEDSEFDISGVLRFLPKAIICNSSAVAKRFGDVQPPKVKVILNGVDVNYFNIVNDHFSLRNQFVSHDVKIVGIVSNLTKRRGIEFFIKASSLIRNSYPNVYFVVVGGEFEEAPKGRLEKLKAQVKLLGMAEHFLFAGYQADVRPWINIFDVSCHVTRNDACSRSILEAMSMQRAIVAMNEGGNPELIDHGTNGLLVNPNKIEDFVNAVVIFLQDDLKRNQFGCKARNKACTHFDIKTNARLTEELYGNLLKD